MGRREHQTRQAVGQEDAVGRARRYARCDSGTRRTRTELVPVGLVRLGCASQTGHTHGLQARPKIAPGATTTRLASRSRRLLRLLRGGHAARLMLLVRADRGEAVAALPVALKTRTRLMRPPRSSAYRGLRPDQTRGKKRPFKSGGPRQPAAPPPAPNGDRRQEWPVGSRLGVLPSANDRSHDEESEDDDDRPRRPVGEEADADEGEREKHKVHGKSHYLPLFDEYFGQFSERTRMRIALRLARIPGGTPR